MNEFNTPNAINFFIALATAGAAIASLMAARENQKTAIQAKRQADAAFEAIEAQQRPYLMMSPHPTPNEHGQSEACIVNFSGLPTQINGGWLETLNSDTEPGKHIGSISNITLSTPHDARLTLPNEYVKFTVYDESLQSGWYVLRLMFKYPKLPEKGLLLEIPLRKHETGFPTYLLDLAEVIKYDAANNPPTSTWTAEALENRSRHP
jgi:hypothetical protein